MKGLIISIAAAALLLTTAIAGYSLNSNDGAVIYASNCASCHGADDATIDIKTATVGQITKAYKNNTSMQNSVLRTNATVIGHGPNGKLTLGQKNAIVASLKIYRGEDLFNAKFTDPSQTTWNCSYCHGSYDNTPMAGKNYNQILKGFRKNSNMKLTKSHYKLSELHLIAKALMAATFTNSTSGGGGTTTIDGAKLYYIDCINCHNGPISVVAGTAPDYNGTQPDIVKVATAGSPANGATLIQDAINDPTNSMNKNATLLSLTPDEIKAIATAIQLDQVPTDLSIYTSPSCAYSATDPKYATCHNPDGSHN
jgi:mono/diheme cytochrome c family protein